MLIPRVVSALLNVYVGDATSSAPTRVTALRANAPLSNNSGCDLHAHLSKQLALKIFIEPESREGPARILLKQLGDRWIRLYLLLERGNNRLDILAARVKYALDNGCFFSRSCHTLVLFQRLCYPVSQVLAFDP